MAETTLYNPASLREEDLISNFVVRTKTFENIFKDIKNSDMKYPEKHYLIQGQRGMGKTTLLLRLKYEIERTDSLKNWLVPIFFNEETYDINGLASLWEKLLKYLDDYFDTDGEYYEATEEFVDQSDYEKLCFNYLIKQLNKRGKKLILFFDNFGELFLNNLKDKEKRRLREILIECTDIRIVGGSAVVINDLHDYSQPFFEFFQIIRLEGLTKEETYDLIAKLQEDCDELRRIDLKKNKSKIDTLAVLTGGVIRTIMMLYQVLLDDPNGTALYDLEKVLDKATPLYKHRIEDLPAQQRRIVDVIAKKWDAVSAKDIAAEIREDGKKMSTKLISAQLSQLEKNNVVEKKSTTTKNHLYQLRERFFNIWYLMRNGDRRDKKRVAWLTKFLEMWYDDEDSFDKFLENHIDSLRSGKYVSSSALLLAEALINSDKLDPNKMDGLIEETSNVLKEDEKKYLPNMEDVRIALAIKFYKNGNVEKAINALSGIQNKTNRAYLLLAYYYHRVNSIELAKETIGYVESLDDETLDFYAILCIELESYSLLLNKLKQSTGLNKGKVQYIIGNLYLAQKRSDLALTHYRNALDYGVKSAWIKIKDIYEQLGQFDLVEEMLLESFQQDETTKTDILNFYAFKSKDFSKLKEWLTDFDKNANYYLYKSLIEINETVEGAGVKFENIIPDLEKSIELFLLEGGKDMNMYMSAIILLLYYIQISKDLNAASKLIEEVDSSNILEFGPYNVLKIFVFIWKGEYSSPKVAAFFDNLEIDVEDNLDLFNDLLLLLLSKHQYHFLFNQFEKNIRLKELFKPTYYALMTLMEDELPNEIIKMGDELKIPVEEILEKVEQMKIDYK